MGSDDKMETDEAEASEETTEETAATSTRPSKKRPRSPIPEEPSNAALQQAAVSAASAAAAAQLSASMGWNGLYSLLSASAITTSTTNVMPSVEQVEQAATKCVLECPPFVHLSKTDSAPQLKILDDRRLIIKGGMRGYRMSRATHGVSSGNFYYEAILLDPPPVSEIAASLPPNVRMGKKLQAQIQQALLDEKEGRENSTIFGGHVRLGWSMRTGDLQAPVGYDKWSFGLRDIGGSKIHCSKRDDNWGGDEFGPGDVVGCALSLPPKDEDGTSSEPNIIKFFKNGNPMGEIVVSKGKREGGDAFHPPDGVYYPSISTYMGASVKLNTGPYFIYPPRKQTAGFKLQPVSDLCKPPTPLDEAIAKAQKEKPFRKSDMLQKFQDLVQTEAQVLQDFYQNHRKKHVKEVAEEREKRNLSIVELEEDEFYTKE
jgi:Set1/Ash2 histone methyltransferase complex subunit ASH2